MKIFLDTSSLVKLYHNEDGSEELIQLFQEQNIEAIFLSNIAKLEFSSAVYKKVRTRELSENEANELIQLFESDFSKYSFINCNNEIVEEANKLLKLYGANGLRSLDSIQLASMIKVKQEIDIAKSADVKLNAFITSEGIRILI